MSAPTWNRIIVSAACVLVAVAAVSAQRPDPLGDSFTDLVREPSIAYFTTPSADPVAKLIERLTRGETKLAYEPGLGYLRSVLEALRVPVASQMLVFSKTSVQAVRINPKNPRALYFNDAVSVGFIPNADYLEFAAQDPRQGTIFYTLEQRPAEQPAIVRRDFCLTCHYAYATLGVPGMLVRSVVTSPTGGTLPQFGNYVSDHRSPLAERWGGYYVTGTHGSIRHLGNAMLVNRDDPDSMVTAETLNVRSLASRVDLTPYLSPHSDIAALMVFEHQMRAVNVLTRAGWEVRYAIDAGKDVAARAREMATEVVDDLLFIAEAPIDAPLRGTSTFADEFAAAGPHDAKGRSLRQLALDRRLMRYPCSYMIYSAEFDAMPDALRDAVYHRLWDVLSGAERGADYARLSAADRQAILDILRATKLDLPSYYQPASQ